MKEQIRKIFDEISGREYERFWEGLGLPKKRPLREVVDERMDIAIGAAKKHNLGIDGEPRRGG